MYLASVIQSEVSKRENQALYIKAYVESRKMVQGRNRDTDIENRYMDTGGEERVGGTNWEIGIYIYTLVIV